MTFVQQEVPQYIKQLKTDDEPLWGSMSVQHMVEHMTIAIKASYGRIKAEPMTDEAKMSIRKERFFSNDMPMPKGVRVNFAPETPGPLYYKNLDEAKEKLFHDLAAFFQYYKENPDAQNLHPGFGLLNYEEWIQMHGRHFLHHLKQFGLIPE